MIWLERPFFDGRFFTSILGLGIMKFFEHQKKARAATIKLLFLFGFAVVSVSSFISGVLIFAYSSLIRDWKIRRLFESDFADMYGVEIFARRGGKIYLGDGFNQSHLQALSDMRGSGLGVEGGFNPSLSAFDLYFFPFIWLTLFLMVFILILSAMRLSELRNGGGDFVAESLGGKLLRSNETELKKKQLVNIVEEMAIASGLSVPRVYLIDKQSINAFAAGWTISDAVIGVTSGCVNALTREEMQGVIAHEFSHILNGDMRLNMRLMAAVHGIAFFAEWGKTIKLAALAKEPVNKVLLFLVGCLIFIIGWVGLLCAKIIQAAVSRQREFLADASAVQFTRNSDGIVGALQKIERAAEGSTIHHLYAFETSHLFFGDIDSKTDALLATHPSIPERIARIKGGRFAPQKQSTTQSKSKSKPQLQANFLSDQLIHSVGTMKLSTQTAPRLLVISLEEHCREAAGAVAILYAMLLPIDPQKRAALRGYVAQQSEPAIATILQKIDADLLQLARPQCFKLLSRALPSLKMLSQNQAARALEMGQLLIEADKQMNFFEFCIWQLAEKGLRIAHPTRQPHLMMGGAASRIFGLFACLSRTPDLAYQQAIAAAKIHAYLPTNPTRLGDFKELDAIFDTLAQASFGIKEKILTGCVAAVLADGNIREDESVLLQAFCLAMDVPLPPMQVV
jgi:Zn-dependent protease with chaperone function